MTQGLAKTAGRRRGSPWLRAGGAGLVGYLLIRLTTLFAAALPLSRADAALTAAVLGAAVGLPLLCWAIGANSMMRLSGAVMAGGTAVATVILLLS